MKIRSILLPGLLILLHVATSAFANEKWQTFSHCQLVQNQANDGDSFHVKHEGKEYIFRLYFVDTPETENEYAERVQEQADYFKIKHDEAIRVGKVAAKFTFTQLKNDFTVVTRLEHALGQSKLPRYYGFVLVNDKANLAELLVQNGLARIHGEYTDLPGKFTKQEFLAKLKRHENAAKQQKRGGWSTPPGENVEMNPASAAVGSDYTISPSGQRHNSRCRLFNTPLNKPCGAQDGKPCPYCGG